jgi:hypothetical protein
MPMFRYEGWCPSCEIYFTKRRIEKEEGDWETSHMKLEELDQELSKKEIKALWLRMEK